MRAQMEDRAYPKQRRGRARPRRRRRAARTLVLLCAAMCAGGILLGAKALGGEPAPAASPPMGREADFTLAQMRQKMAEGAVQAENTADEGGDAPGAGSWNLLLVNPWHPLPADYQVTLAALQNGQAVDERCYPELQEMMDSCRAQGLRPVICSSYRTQEKQERLFENQVNGLISRGYPAPQAREEAGKAVAVPGTSEHQLGLAVDIVDAANQNLDESQEHTAVQQWLMENSWRYGFILRYPAGKSDVTGIIYEPWHYRYVGRAAAKAIYGQGVCLEEYLGQQGSEG